MQLNGYGVLVSNEQEEQESFTYTENIWEREKKEEEVLFFDDFDFKEGYLMLYD